MIDEAANPWLPKSPAESFSVWGRDATEKDITLVISSGAVMRKQTIIQLVDPPKEDQPEGDPPEGDPSEGDPKQMLKLEYAVEFLNAEQKAVKLTLANFPVIIGFLDGKIKKTDINLKTFEDLEDDTEEKLEGTLPSGNDGIKNKKPEITDAEEGDEEENINVPPNAAKFIPLRYITCGKDSFNELMLTGAKWIVESNIVLGNNVISSGKNKKPKEDKEASSDECEYGEGHLGEKIPPIGLGGIRRIEHDPLEGGKKEDEMPEAPCQERGEDSGIPVPEGETVPGNVPPINPPANPPPNQPNNPPPIINPPANPPPNNDDDIDDYIYDFINVYD